MCVLRMTEAGAWSSPHTGPVSLPHHTDPCRKADHGFPQLTGKSDPPVRGILEINHWGVLSRLLSKKR